MPTNHDTVMDDLLQQRRQAKDRALELERTIRKRKKEQRVLLKKFKGATSEQLLAAAERAKEKEDAARASS